LRRIVIKQIVINKNFDNFEGFASTAHAWDVDFLQIEKGRFEANLTQFVYGDLQFAKACFNRGLDQKGASPEGVWTFAITFSPDALMYFKGREINGNNNLMIYQPGSEIDAISKSAFGVLTFSASEQFLELLAENNKLSGFRNKCRSTDVLVCKKRDIQNLRFLLTRLLSDLEKAGHQSNDGCNYTILESIIPEAVLRTIYHHNDQAQIPVWRLRDAAFKHAVAFVHAHARENVSVERMVHQTRVSKRTLEYVFQERLGVTPKRYIRTYRLNRVRKELTRSAYSIGRVTDIANHWGFWHMGQFAIDYKEQFGELPSKTLKNRTTLGG
jgi:AraC family transcriptional regulator, ethanolamine operon transcriptional activator